MCPEWTGQNWRARQDSYEVGLCQLPGGSSNSKTHLHGAAEQTSHRLAGSAPAANPET